MTVGSLFSGIGGIDLGLERAGMTIRWQAEVDPWCRSVLAHHWPTVRRYHDVKDLTDHDVERVDLIAGGFPCTDISSVGRRAGLQGEQSRLWSPFAGVLRRLRPRYVLVENSPALLVRGMDDVLGDLSASGYDAEWEVFPAAAVGAPHVRARLWLLAYTCRDGDRSSHRTVFAGRSRPQYSRWWVREPEVGRVAHGLPRRVDRLRGLGNAVVPQLVEWLGRRILELEV